MTKLNEQTLIPIGLAIGLIGGGSYWLTSLYQQVQVNTNSINRISDKLDSILQIKTDIELIKKDVINLQKPVLNTQFNVKRVNAKINRLAAPRSSSKYELSDACIMGQFSMSESGQ